MIEKIVHTDYEGLCDSKWESGELPSDRTVVYVPTDHVFEFFESCEQSNKKFVLVSSNSDYMITEQSRHKVEKDVFKWLRFVDTTGLGYRSVMVDTRCESENCKINDRYSQKLYSWTKATFSNIPNNIVAWFGTNLDIEDSRITRLTFGLPKWSVDLLKHQEKTHTLYINFQNNTLDRSSLYAYYKSLQDPRILIEKEVSHEQYIGSLSKCKYALSPPGNGFSCFRTNEALMCGVIPIVQKCIASKAYDNLPVIQIDSLICDVNDLDSSWKNLHDRIDWSLENSSVDFRYWRTRVNESRKLLN